MEILPILIFFILIFYFIINRISEKEREKFEKRDN